MLPILRQIAFGDHSIMEFTWTKDQQERYDTIVSFAQSQLESDARARDRNSEFDQSLWKKCGEFGLTGFSIPAEYGGMGLDALSTAHAMEAFGQGCEDMGLVFAVSAHLFACAMPINEWASNETKSRILPLLASGDWIASNAITEAEAGSDVHALKARARRQGDSYVITGEKTYATNAPVADAFILYATTNPDHGYMGLTAFIVERDTPGFTIGKAWDKMGLRTALTSSVYLDACEVPVQNRLGAEGQGAMVFQSSMLWERACLFGFYIGMMERQLQQIISHAVDRTQFDKPIGKFQGVSHRIVDMKIRLETARLILYRACWKFDQGEDATLEIAMAKLVTSEAAVQSSLDAISLLGGMGVVADLGVERQLRDSIPGTIFSGTSNIQRNLIAAKLGI
jgi:alkylation response protein AidB-like acyl-CoA dehydrogenase